MDEASDQTCRQPGCGGPASGVCIENFSFEECPNLRPLVADEREEEIVGAGVNEPAEVPQDIVQTGNLTSLDAAACDALLRAREATVVGLVAAPEVGKTTMIATLYELVRRGKIEGFGFAGSETIRGLEERCFLSRTTSKGAKPDTLHTPTRAGLSFTHVRIATGGGVEEIVFSDRSGEHFQRVLDTPATVADFAELDRASKILLLVDGEQLVLSRHRPMAEARRLFMALAQANQVLGRPILIVATKRDLVPEARMAELDESLAELTRDLRSRAPGANISSYATGARPRQGPEFGEGFDTLLSALLASSGTQEFRSYIPTYSGERAFERLTVSDKFGVKS